jgi:hypothetical protein
MSLSSWQFELALEQSRLACQTILNSMNQTLSEIVASRAQRSSLL